MSASVTEVILLQYVNLFVSFHTGIISAFQQTHV